MSSDENESSALVADEKSIDIVRAWGKAWNRSWTCPPAPLHVNNISLEEVMEIEDKLRGEGFKPSWDWDGYKRKAIFRTLTALQHTPSEWMVSHCGAITAHLCKVALCGRPNLFPSFRAEIKLLKDCDGSYRYVAQPDAQLSLADVGNHREKLGLRGLRPRIVLETTACQPLEHVMDKAWRYLYYSDNDIQAVLVCNMTDPKHPSTFKVTIGVWRRTLTGDVDLDFPLDRCMANNENEHKVVPSLTESDGADFDVAEAEEQAPSTPSNNGSSAPLESLPNQVDENMRIFAPEGESRTIERRDLPTVVYDANRAPDDSSYEDLVLDTYDIIRACDQRPNDYLPEHHLELTLPLTDLRQSISRNIWLSRYDPHEGSKPQLNVSTPRRRGKPKSP